MSTTAYATVLAWQEAVNSGDTDTLIELSTDGIELADDHRGVQGITVLYQWATETNTTLDTTAVYERRGTVVTDTVASGSIVPGEADEARRVGIAFGISGDRIGSVFVHRDLAAAFTATGLGDGDVVQD